MSEAINQDMARIGSAARLAAPADQGVIVVPGSRGDLTYIVQPRLENADRALHSLAHGAGRKWSRSEAKAKLERRFTINDLERTKLGSRVICEDRELIYEEAPQAYKAIHQVIEDLKAVSLIDARTRSTSSIVEV